MEGEREVGGLRIRRRVEYFVDNVGRELSLMARRRRRRSGKGFY